MTEKQLREKLVATAVAWLGYKEADGTHQQILAVYNAHKPLARGYTVKPTDAWCSTYASAVAIKAGMTDIIPTECGCEPHVLLFKSMGRWVENDAYTPQIGDYILYDWDDSGNGDCTGHSDHIGIVTAVNGTTITVIEGNKGNAVGYRTMTVNGKYIRGYGCPDYAKKATGAEDNTDADQGAAQSVAVHTVAPGDTLGRIAAQYGTTVAKLATVNAIENVNLIHVGQKLYTTATAKLAALGVINSPDYWQDAITAGAVEYLGDLLDLVAGAAKKAGDRTETPEDGVAALVAAGIVNTPAYWLAKHNTFPSLGLLLCALGGAVK